MVRAILKIFLLGYVVLIFISNMQCKPDHPAENDLQNKSKAAKYLLNKHKASFLPDSANEFSLKFQKQLMNRTVVLDSIVGRLIQENGEFYVKAEVASDSTCRIFAKLKCSEKQKDNIKKSKFPYALIAANISRIDKSDSKFGIVDIHNEKKTIAFGSEILITGECIEIIELNYF